MQHPHSFRETTVSVRPARMIAFAGEFPSETQSVREAKQESKQPLSPAESDAQQAKRREQRDTLQRREAWERECEQMDDKQLLGTLYNLQVRQENLVKLHSTLYQSKEPERREECLRNIAYVQRLTDDAREVLIDRKRKENAGLKLDPRILTKLDDFKDAIENTGIIGFKPGKHEEVRALMKALGFSEEDLDLKRNSLVCQWKKPLTEEDLKMIEAFRSVIISFEPNRPLKR